MYLFWGLRCFNTAEFCGVQLFNGTIRAIFHRMGFFERDTYGGMMRKMSCNEYLVTWTLERTFPIFIGWWFQTWMLFSISYMGCHPSHWRTHIFQDGYCTTNQFKSRDLVLTYPLVNIQKIMENHHVEWEISRTFHGFNSYFDIRRGYPWSNSKVWNQPNFLMHKNGASWTSHPQYQIDLVFLWTNSLF